MMSYVVLRLAFLHNSASRPFKFAGLAPGHHDGKSSSSLLETASAGCLNSRIGATSADVHE